jgi:hypothetical protein
MMPVEAGPISCEDEMMKTVFKRVSGFALSFGLMAVSLATIQSASAEALAMPLQLQCLLQDIGAASGQASSTSNAVAVTYDGDAEGTLSVKASFGELTLPATKTEVEGSVAGVNDGKPYKVIGIRASGPGVVLMPDKAEIETCVASKVKPDDPDYADLAFMATLSCTGSLPVKSSPVPIEASVEIAISEMQDAKLEIQSVFLKRTFAESTNLPGGSITIESNLNCDFANK